MAIITLTQKFSDLGQWPGRLFEVRDPGTTFTSQTATNLTFILPPTSDFAGFRIQITGTGFAYDGGVAVDGTMATLRVFDPAGALVISFTGLGASPFAADLAQFYALVFGSTVDDNGPDADGKGAWNLLTSGNDTINGTAGNDWQGMPGLNLGNDVFNMGTGDDYFEGGAGNDTYNGGDGWDTMSFTNTHYSEGQTAFRGLAVNMAAGTLIDVWGGTDTFSGIEEVHGSRFNDLIEGDGNQNTLSGGRGRDTLDGGQNSYDALGNRQDWRDRVSYQNDYWEGGSRGIVVNLETAFNGTSITGTIRDGFGQLDVVRDIERVVGTRFDDVFNGSRANNRFDGGEGRDRYDGKDGFDFINFDRWFGDTALGAVRVDLTRATGQIQNDGFGNVETTVNVEGFRGGAANDWFRGTAGTQEFWGGRGTDTLAGGAGSDYFVWGARNELGQTDVISDFTATGPDRDTLAFDVPFIQGMSTTLTLVNGTAATAAVDTFIFNTTTKVLWWDPDGTGAQAALSVARLAGVASLSADNFELWF